MAKTKTWVIYKHTLLTDCEHKGWSYIGQTCQAHPNRRWGYLGKSYSNQIFYQAIQKYGWDAFSHEILESGIQTLEEANERESYWISYYHTYINDENCHGYNLTRGGQTGSTVEGRHWYTNGLIEIICFESDVPSGFMRGKLPMSDLQKEKLKAYLKNLPESHRQHLKEALANHIRITKDGVEKYIDQIELDHYLAAGWVRGIPESHKLSVATKIICIETGEVFSSIKEAQKKYPGHIGEVIAGSRKTAGGYHWKLFDEASKPKKCTARPDDYITWNAKKIKCIETDEIFNSITSAVAKYGRHVPDVLTGRRKHTHHLHFEYLIEEL